MRYKILEEGIIKSGYVELDVQSDGSISYSGEVTVKLGPFTKTKDFSGMQKVDPEVIKSEKYRNAGDTFENDNVLIAVTSATENTSDVMFNLKEGEIGGIGTIDTTQEIISVINGEGEASYLGQDFTVKIERE